VGELLPAAMEATYAGLPLVLVTADRPRSYRGKGAPQSVEQCGIFSHYAEKLIDIENINEGLETSDWSRQRPLHINVCFDEPLIDSEISEIDFSTITKEKNSREAFSSNQTRQLKNPIVIVGEVKPHEKSQILNFLERFKAPIYAEGISNLRGEATLENYLLSGGEKVVEKAIAEGCVESILRLGGVPTLRCWRDLEEKFKNLPVHSCSSDEWTGLSRKVSHLIGIKNLELYQNQSDENLYQKIYEFDQNQTDQLEVLVQRYPNSEVGLFFQLAEATQNQNVYLGNSLPIREWDLAPSTNFSYNKVTGNRGANGIDGQISTFLGWAEKEKENWCIVGDLTALYDLSSLWIYPKLKTGALRIVVVNNSGGQIFNRMFKKESFLNTHNLQFQKWAEMWSWDYIKAESLDEKALQQIKSSQNIVIELVPSKQQSDDFWMGYQLIK
jgi:2-succinyl-5-enolpyruvyl-6-hydroxy-3-cyclohexene-1-carboxylate synthase